jgi:hypothetical protein
MKQWIREKDPLKQHVKSVSVMNEIFTHPMKLNKAHATDLSIPFHALIDNTSHRVMFVSNSSELIRTLGRIPNMICVFNATTKPTIGCRLWEVPETFDSEYPWNFISLDQLHYQQKFIESKEIMTIEEIYNSYLIWVKAVLLNDILATIETLRIEDVSTLQYQELIYSEKYRQAKQIIDNDIVEDTENLYYYVSDWAKVNDYSLRESAKDIVLNYDCIQHRLAKTEYVRNKFIKMIRDETDLANMPKILKDFTMFNFGYLRL